MNGKTTNSKYTIWLYDIYGHAFNYLTQAFPNEHFLIKSDIYNQTDFYEIEKMQDLDKPDIVICGLNTTIDNNVRKILDNSCCTLVRITLKDLDSLIERPLETTLELSQTQIEIFDKKDKKNPFKKTTKLEDSIHKITEICQMANISKVQKIMKNKAKETLVEINVEQQLQFGKTFDKVSKDYLFKLANQLNDFITLKDNYTSGHCKRVAIYAEALGHYLNLSNEEIEDLILAANLHDIGKIALPDAIINKDGKLSDLEFNLMKSHVKLGASILPDEQLGYLSKIIRAHHEKYDGTGYPDGLKGEEIPFFAQILAIADSFDAMTSQRSYNKVKSTEEAFKDLIAHTKPYGVEDGLGIFYNPKLVDAFIKVIRNSNTIMNDLAQTKAMADLKYDYKARQDEKKNNMDQKILTKRSI